MVRIYFDRKGTKEFLVQTTCLDASAFVSELAEVLHEAIARSNGDGALVALGILENAMPIAFKLSGYKADTVSEQRTLVCGVASPAACEVIATAGR